uniref:glucuronosyltransferase n=1 Tax=Parastrongyloides trichosuri TaxID=131310 RepID=A0A0N4ZLM9_PARTI
MYIIENKYILINTLRKMLIFFLFFILSNVDSYKILIYNPKFAISHMSYFSNIADILVEAGHDVTVLCPEMSMDIKHPGSKKGKNINYPGHPIAYKLLTNNTSLDNIWKSNESTEDQLEILTTLFTSLYHQSLKIFNDEEFMKNMTNEKFDFAIAESINLHAFGFFKIWGINAYASATSTPMLNILYKDFGLHFPSSFVPTLLNTFGEKITYTERILNIVNHLALLFYESHTFEERSLQRHFNKKFGPNVYDAKTFIGDSSFLLLNSIPILNDPFPKSPKMLEIGGLNLEKPNKLNEYWDNLLSIRKKNVLISFGSLIKCSKMLLSMKNGIIKTAEVMKDITFIWKYDNISDLESKVPKNLILKTWIPQYDIISDKRLNIFINHAGINSLFEAVYSGVLSLNIPICNDQFNNAKVAQNLNIAKTIHKEDLSNSDFLVKKIKEMMEDKKLLENVKLFSDLLKNQPISGKELLVRYVEYGAKFGSLKQLDLRSKNMNFIEYHNLDIYLPIAIIFIILILKIIMFIRKQFNDYYQIKYKTD